MKAALAAAAIVAGIAWWACADAQVYRCTAADGSVSFQDRACSHGQTQTIIDVAARGPDSPAAAATTPLPDAVAAAPPAAYLSPPPAPLPELYACVGAVNGKHYLTSSPPPPYLAPLGVMGYPPQSLSQAYGAPGGAGMSAPELSHPRVGGPRIATGMTEVQDYCLPAAHAEVCGYVRKAYDENHRKLRMAMPNEQPPFEQRERNLQDQLRNCR